MTSCARLHVVSDFFPHVRFLPRALFPFFSVSVAGRDYLLIDASVRSLSLSLGSRFIYLFFFLSFPFDLRVSVTRERAGICIRVEVTPLVFRPSNATQEKELSSHES